MKSMMKSIQWLAIPAMMFSFVALANNNPSIDGGAIKLKATVNQAFAVDLSKHTYITGEYKFLNGPDWLSLSTAGILFGTPTEQHIGTNEAYLEIKRNGKEELFKLEITVAGLTNPFELEHTALVGEVFKLDFQKITGLKGTFNYSAMPAWLRSSEGGVVYGLPELKDVGVTRFEVSITNAERMTTYYVTLTVKEKATSEPAPFVIRVNEFISIDLYRSIQVPGEYWVQAPRFLRVTPSGYLQGTPRISDIGVHNIDIQVRQMSSFGQLTTHFFRMIIKVE